MDDILAGGKRKISEILFLRTFFDCGVYVSSVPQSVALQSIRLMRFKIQRSNRQIGIELGERKHAGRSHGLLGRVYTAL